MKESALMSAFFSRRAAVGLAVTLAVVGPGVPVSAAPAVPAAPSSPASSTAPKTGQVTLITGDTVQVTAAGGGRFSATVQPAPGREQITFHTLEVDGTLRVLPSDVIPAVASGAVDADLFDVQELIAEGYGDGNRDSLPLIVTYRNPGAARLKALAGVDTTRTLNSIGGAALSADKADLAGFWKATGVSATSRSASPELGQGIKNIWLDAKIHPNLDRSTAQIGAPTVWKGGHDGKGVKVAVLDTGIDATHPDLSSQITAAQSFTGDPDTTDRFGHGTHVASIIAGTGAASGGTRKGVAPGAKLLIGKVLGDDGSGQESWIIGAMEWAAAQHATVVNMSLGGGATDGTDPMSLALDRITADTGTLFVVAAGNEGADQTVGTPGTAKSALTVGAVDRDDTLATFSSRGPRLGDEGLKPEITAPGVGIMAALAVGTDLGGAIDGQYTALSGTSMATPHVAGAAALLAQVHPTWTATRLKNALVSTAHTAPDATVFGQGAGRVDTVRATTQAVQATGVADFGLIVAGTKTPQQQSITYTNDAKSAVTLALKLNVTNLTTGVKGSAAITLPGTVTVPAGTSVAVPITVAPTTLARGQYSGWVTATGADDVLTTTAVGITLEGPKHRVRFTAVNRAGQPTNVPVIMLHGNNPRSDYLGYLLGGVAPDALVEEGTYLLDSLIEDNGPPEQATLITDPEVKITKDITIALDARKGNPIRIETPEPSEQQNILSYYVHRVTSSGRQIDHGVMHFSNVKQVNVTPTKKPTAGTYEFSSRWQLVAPLVQASVSGASGPIEAHLTRAAPAFTGRRRFPLVDGGKGKPADLVKAKLKGAAVIIRSSDDTDPDPGPDEYTVTAAAAEAGAAAVLFVRTWGSWTSWSPEGERDAIPSLAVPQADGQKLITQAGRGHATFDLTLTPSSPYLYDVQQVSAGFVPDRIVYRVTAKNSARITSRYADNGGFTWQKEQRFGWRPWQTFAWNDQSRFVETPKVREEWVTTGDSIWQQQVRNDWPWGDLGPLTGGVTELPRTYRPGSSTATWLGAIVRPAAPRGVADLVSTRTGDTLNLRVPEFVDSDGHFAPYGATSAAVVLRRDGAVLAEAADGMQDVATTAKSAAYTLAMQTTRAGDEWTWATRTDTTWGFRSASSGTAAKPLPLLQVDYATCVDLSGKATRATHSVDLTLRQQDGPATPKGTRLTLQISANEGRTWTSAKVTGSGTHYRAVVPAGTGTVSLRVKATDGGGNTIDQTVIRAYGRR
jgi:subtilisin family serine protease